MQPLSKRLIGGEGRLRNAAPRSEVARKPKAIVAVQHPIQHFSAAFREIAMRGEIDLAVLYWDDLQAGQHDPGFNRHVSWDVELLSGYEYFRSPQGPRAARRSAWRWLAQQRADVVIAFGWATPAARTALAYARFSRTAYLLYGDNSWQHRLRSFRSVLRDAALNRLSSGSAGALTTGTFNREDFIRLGVHPATAFPSVYPIDTARFHVATNPTRPTTRVFTIGFAGKLLPRKGVDELIRSLAYIDSEVDWRCVIVGDGPELEMLSGLVIRLGLSDRVEFAGFANQSAMPATLASFDVLVVPSYVDMRVLIVSEAMAVGTPVVVSSGTAVWGEGDQLRHNLTGWVYRSGHPEELGILLSRLRREPKHVSDVADRALREEVPRFTPEAFARSVEGAVGHVVGVSR